MSDTPSGPIVTLWDGDGIERAWLLSRAWLRLARPRAVQLHTWTPGDVARAIRAELPGVTLVHGVGVDGIARDVALGRASTASAAATFVSLASRAVSVGACAILWNAEASYKRPPSSPERARLVEAIRAGLAAVAERFPDLAQWHSAYDHPTYHSTYPWAAWLGPHTPIRASWAQVYAAPGGAGVMAARGALPRREATSLASWAAAVRAGWIAPDAPEGTPEDAADVDWRPYLQLHSVPAVDTVSVAVSSPAAMLWALSSRRDAEGLRAATALVALERAGFWGDGAVQAFQRARGLTVDGVCGPNTTAALLAAASIDPRALPA